MSVEHFDVLVVGAGLSGIGAGYHLQSRCPGKRYAILEGRRDLGGTWDLFRYPGVRSDSDMFTFGYSFRPWKEAKTVADGPAILQYLRESAAEHGIDRHIRFQQRVRSVSWSSEQARWTVEVTRGEDKELVSYTCHFLYLCSGYYDYEQGHAPQFAGSNDFHGQLIHPQQWPGKLDYRDKRIIVIGSGATAVTLVPALAQTAAHVTMLQRSPSYLFVLPTDDRVAQMLGKLCPEWLAHRLTRWKNVLLGIYFYQLCRRSPERAKKLFRAQLAKELPPNFDIETHFQPYYEPWDQRVCIVPDGNLFRTIREGRVSVVTEQIANLTKHGVVLQSGRELQADIIVTATGLKLLPCGGVRLFVDGRAVEPGQSLTYKGVMLSNVPNLAACVGYVNAAWTLRADLSSAYVCRLLNYMDRHAYTSCVPRWDDAALGGRPLLGLTSAYVQRAADLFPKQGVKAPWLLHQNYLLDLLTLQFSRLNDGFIVFSKGSPRAVPDRKVSPLAMHNSVP